MLNKLNNCFLCDEDKGLDVAEAIFFYGLTTLVFIIVTFAVIGIFTL